MYFEVYNCLGVAFWVNLYVCLDSDCRLWMLKRWEGAFGQVFEWLFVFIIGVGVFYRR